MRFQVPQFIEIEDKIFGPLTLKQFLYVAGGAGIGFILFSWLGAIGLIFAVPIAGFGAALAFYKFNSKPFSFLVEAAFNYLISSKLYLWRRTRALPQSRAQDKNTDPLLFVPKLPQAKLKDVNWNLDTKETNGPDTQPARK
jgi:hypothetical protein